MEHGLFCIASGDHRKGDCGCYIGKDGEVHSLAAKYWPDRSEADLAAQLIREREEAMLSPAKRRALRKQRELEAFEADRRTYEEACRAA